MPTLYNLLAVALALQQSLDLANPLPVAEIQPLCLPKTSYTITSANPQAVGQGITGDLYCNGNDQGCDLSQQQSFAETVEVSVGLDLDFGEILAGVSPSLSIGASISKQTGTAPTAGKTCPPGPWTCALVFSPNVLHVEGTQTRIPNPCVSSNEATTSPYIMDFPQANTDGVYGGGIDICVCTDFAHWADNGAPSIHCPQPCTKH